MKAPEVMTRYRRWINPSYSNTYFVTTTLTGFVPLFNNPRYARIIASAIGFQVASGRYSLLAFVIMPEHVHLVLCLPQRQPISEIVRALKSWTSRKITEALQADNNEQALNTFANHARAGSHYAVWQRSFRAFPIGSERMLKQKMKYIHENPVRRGLVVSPEEYRFSSAKAYAGSPDALLEVCFPA